MIYLYLLQLILRHRESKISAYETIGMHASLEKIYIKLHFEGKNELLYVLNGDNYFSENVPCQRRALDHIHVRRMSLSKILNRMICTKHLFHILQQ